MGRAERAAAEDPAGHYETLRRELVDLVRDATEAERATRVPATPAWSVRDVVAHVVGITEDLNHLDFGAGDGDAWTRAQVERHRDQPIAAVLAAWDRQAPTFESGLRIFGYDLGSHYVGDLLVHLTDVRTALGLGPPPDDVTLRIALDFYLDSLDEALRSQSAGALEVRTASERRVVGAGEPAAALRASPFEVLRACAGRRTRAEIDAYEWDGDRARFVSRLSRYPMPTTPVGA